ncbi:MAG TPA: hypothetical protein VJU18_02450 [Vicinamibacteria bacterium]|nr:hypothetical protein [Vicinamibacteria bacterium]
MGQGDDTGRRVGWSPGPNTHGEVGHEWLTLSDDDLLQRIEALATNHDDDQALLTVVRSHRHFFIRQEAAKRVTDHALLQAHPDDRHIGQILVRRMTRKEDLAYLEHLVTTSRYLEVRKAAEAQLQRVRALHDEA